MPQIWTFPSHETLHTTALSLIVFVLLPFASHLFSYWGSSLVCEVLLGSIFGPPVLDLLPATEALRVLGHIGLWSLVLEGGLGVTLDRLRKGWTRALGIALIGVLASTALGFGTFRAFGYGNMQGLAAGVALGSTSIGIATRVLRDRELLDSGIGSVITLAAIIDDIISLISLAVFVQLGNNEEEEGGGLGYAVGRPVGSSVVLLVIGYFVAWVTDAFTRSRSRTISFPTDANWDKFLFAILVVTSVGLATLSDMVGSTPLLGPFLAGMIFAPPTFSTYIHKTWSQTAPLILWLQSTFFLTIGFDIPLKHMFSGKPLGIGFATALIGGMGGKIFCGVVIGLFGTGQEQQSRDSKRWMDGFAVSWSMIGRGELGLLIAKGAYDGGLLDEEGYVATLWAILVPTLVAPAGFKWALALRDGNLKGEDDERIQEVEEVTVHG